MIEMGSLMGGNNLEESCDAEREGREEREREGGRCEVRVEA